MKIETETDAEFWRDVMMSVLPVALKEADLNVTYNRIAESAAILADAALVEYLKRVSMMEGEE